jgi:hypothetical protein
MRRILFAVTTALASLAAVASPPPVSPKPTQNVNIVNTPLNVATREQVVPWEVFALGGLQTIACIAPAGSPSEFVCDATHTQPVTAGLTIHGAMFLPRSVGTVLSEADKAGSCDATYWLSADGVTYVRFLAYSWTPATILSEFVNLPVPVRFAPGAVVHQRVVIQKRGGADPSIACGIMIKSWAIHE